MTLNPQPTYPSLGSYVLKLHRDASPQLGQLRGRLEHIASGEAFEFADAEALVAGLARHAAAQRLATGEAPQPPACLNP
jgi:hypothetical protein